MRVGAPSVTFDDTTEGVQVLGGSQQPLSDLVDATITTDTDHTFHPYPDLSDMLQEVPPYYVPHC